MPLFIINILVGQSLLRTKQLLKWLKINCKNGATIAQQQKLSRKSEQHKTFINSIEQHNY